MKSKTKKDNVTGIRRGEKSGSGGYERRRSKKALPPSPRCLRPSFRSPSDPSFPSFPSFPSIPSSRTHKTLGLVSGGKDSLLSLCWCRALGHEVVAVGNLVPGGKGSGKSGGRRGGRRAEGRRGRGRGGKGDGGLNGNGKNGRRGGGRCDDGDDDDNNDDMDSYMYQTVGHALVPLIAEALGVPCYPGEIWMGGGGREVEDENDDDDDYDGERNGGDDHDEVGFDRSSTSVLDTKRSRHGAAAAAAAAATITGAVGGGGGGSGSGGGGVDAVISSASGGTLAADTLDADNDTDTDTDTLDAETQSLHRLLIRVLAMHPNITAVASGAIYSTYQRCRIEKVAARLGLVSMAWLWEGPGILGDGTGAEDRNDYGEGDDDDNDDNCLTDTVHMATTRTAGPEHDEGEVKGRIEKTVATQTASARSGSRRLLDSLATLGLEARIVKVASGGLDERFLWADLRDGGVRDRLEGRVDFFERMGYGYGYGYGYGGGGSGSGGHDGDNDSMHPSAAVLGEGGEFETLVLDGPWPVFRKRIVVPEGNVRVVPGDCGSASVRVDLEGVSLVDKAAGDHEGVVKCDGYEEAWMRNLARPPLLSGVFRRVLEGVLKKGCFSREGLRRSRECADDDDDVGLRMEDGGGASEHGGENKEKKRKGVEHILRRARWSVKRVGSLLFVGDMLVGGTEESGIGGCEEGSDGGSFSSPFSATATSAPTQLNHILTRLVGVLEAIALEEGTDDGGDDGGDTNSSCIGAAHSDRRFGLHVPTLPLSTPEPSPARNVLKSVLQTTIILRTLSPSVFADVNAVYARFFSFDGPPARVTVSCGGGGDGRGSDGTTKSGSEGESGEVQGNESGSKRKMEGQSVTLPDGVDVLVSVVVDLRGLRSRMVSRRKGGGGDGGGGGRRIGSNESDRDALHVQSQSFWAPANIGPYSQGVAVGVDAGIVSHAMKGRAGGDGYQGNDDGSTARAIDARGLKEVEEEQEEGAAAALSTTPPEKTIFLSGQIPLVPATMNVVRWADFNHHKHSRKIHASIEDQDQSSPLRDFTLQTVLSLQHLYRVSRAMKGRSWFGVLAFVSCRNEEREDGRCSREDAKRRAWIVGECWRRAYLMNRAGKSGKGGKIKGVGRERGIHGNRKSKGTGLVGVSGARFSYRDDSGDGGGGIGGGDGDDDENNLLEGSSASSSFSGGDVDPWDRMYGYGRFGKGFGGVEGLPGVARAEGVAGNGGGVGDEIRMGYVDGLKGFGARRGGAEKAGRLADSDAETERISKLTPTSRSEAEPNLEPEPKFEPIPNSNPNLDSNDSPTLFPIEENTPPPCYTIQMDSLPRGVDVEWAGIAYTGYTDCIIAHADTPNVPKLRDGSKPEMRSLRAGMLDGYRGDDVVVSARQSHASTRATGPSCRYTYVPLRGVQDACCFLGGRGKGCDDDDDDDGCGMKSRAWNGGGNVGGGVGAGLGRGGGGGGGRRRRRRQGREGHVTVYAGPVLMRWLNGLDSDFAGGGGGGAGVRAGGDGSDESSGIAGPSALDRPDQIIPCLGVWDGNGYTNGSGSGFGSGSGRVEELIGLAVVVSAGGGA